MSNSKGKECVPRDQVETVLHFLEVSHGEALRRPWSDAAWAYYEAIQILEDALDEELKSPADLPNQDNEYIQKSRAAREEGYSAATLLEQRYK